MSPSDKTKEDSSSTEENQNQETLKIPTMNTTPELSSASGSDFITPGTIASIPLNTASLPTLKCSINDQVKTFDPGEDSGNERLSSNQFGNSVNASKSSSNSVKGSNKNYKAGSKINKLADMLAKRSQNVVEVSQNNIINVITNSVTKVEESVVLNNVNDIANIKKSLDDSVNCFKKTAKNNELDIFKKNRRKSVPNQSYNLNHMHLQSTSKSCSDFSKLFFAEKDEIPELNALGVSLITLQTDESTKKKAIRKNLKNVELTLILPEKKKKSYARNVCSNKVVEKPYEASSKEGELIEEISKTFENPNKIKTSSVSSPTLSVSSKKIKKENKGKKKKSKKLVETSTQTADLEFINVDKQKPTVENSEMNEKPIVNYNCLYCTQIFSVEQDCRIHEKTHLFKNNKQFIKCQYCSKKLPSLEELKSHYIKKHPNKYAYCLKCDNRFSTKEELHTHNKEVHLNKSLISLNQQFSMEKKSSDLLPEKKKEEMEEKQTERKVCKQNQNGNKTDLKIDVSFESSKKSSVSPRNLQKCSPKETKTEEQLLEMEMLFYSQLSGNIQENLTNHLDGKIDKNGNPVRMDQVKEVADSHAKAKSNIVVTLTSPNTGASDNHVSRAPSPYQTRSKTPNPLPPTAKKFKKLPNWQQKFWEKYNFPTNYRYEHRFWDKNYLNTEKSALYLKDLSCLDIKTQLIMKENIKKLDNIKMVEENAQLVDKLQFPDYLSLIPKENCGINQEVEIESNKCELLELKGSQIKPFKPPGPELPILKTRRKLSTDNNSFGKKQSDRINSEGVKMITRSQSSIDLLKDDKEEDVKKKLINTNVLESQRMSLRRQTSLDGLKKSSDSTWEKNNLITNNISNMQNDSEKFLVGDLPELSGEWVRPRTYLCGACCMKFTNLWELEDHKWVNHPNVWCTHYEFEDEKIENLFQISEDESREPKDSSTFSNLKLTDLYKRYLLPHGSLKTAKLVPSITFPEQCSKCKKSCINSSELHKHMLDCGGDTSWFLTMYSSPMTIKRKWRPFGSRRRKQLGKRDIKRNLPSTPNIRSYPYRPRIRTKPGDMESIQKMLANLPEKRARRVINFDEIKTRSQATIHSNRLLRKRFKSTFASNLLKLKNLKQRRQLKQGKKEGSSKSATDASSESTPVGSPKRKNRLKERLQILGEDNSTEFSSENSRDSMTKSRKKGQTKTYEQNLTKDEVKKLYNKKNQIDVQITKRKEVPSGKEEPSSLVETSKVNLSEAEGMEKKGIYKTSKKQKKKAFDTRSNNFIKNETGSSETYEKVSEIFTSPQKQIKKSNKKVKSKLQKLEGNSKKDKYVDSKSKTNELIKHQGKEKTELLSKMKNKLQDSKKILENKGNSKRRSLRIRFQQVIEPDAESVTIVEDCLPELSSKSSDDALKSFITKKSDTVHIKKSFKANEKKETKEVENIGNTVSLIRRSSRSSLLRNSMCFDEKIDKSVITSDNVEESSKSKVTLLRRNSSNNTRKACISNVPEKLNCNKLPQVQNVDSKLLPQKLDDIRKKQISLVKRNFVQNSELLPSSEIKVKLPNLEEKNANSDLEEMPILAKVEPIRGKAYAKTEHEIPVLMPVDKKLHSSAISNETGTSENSFQIPTKKRRTTLTEITPFKIIKTAHSMSLGEIENLKDDFEQKNNSIGQSGKKIKKKKMSESLDQKIVPIQEKRRRNSTEKKYFLGICPGEIDKGKDENLNESESDTEPLSALINHNQKTNSISSFPEEVPTLENKNFKVLENTILETETEKLSKENEKQDNFTTSNFELKKKPEKIVEFPNINKTLQITKSNFVKPINLIKRVKSKEKIKKSTAKKKVKQLGLTLTLKESILKVESKPFFQPTKCMWTFKAEESDKQENEPPPDLNLPLPETSPEESEKKIELPQINEVNSFLPKRRSRRISKETKSTNEFIIDDPLILVDELWSELDSDSDSSRKKSKKGKKKLLKKKANEEKKTCDVNLEELLRNFGENKDSGCNRKEQEQQLTLIPVKVKRKLNRTFSSVDIRKSLENRAEVKSYKRLSLKLFQFNKKSENFGNLGCKLCDARKILKKRTNVNQSNESRLPDLPFLATEIKENPVQVIQCRSQKSKPIKRGSKKSEAKFQNNSIRFKISLPLESISNITVFNNNHLTELVVEEPTQDGGDNSQVIAQDVDSREEREPFESASEKENHLLQDEFLEMSDIKNKSKRSEIIDKIFYCEICKTYYYSSSQLKIHKQSNRHKLKESELQLTQSIIDEIDSIKKPEENYGAEPKVTSCSSAVENLTGESICHEVVEAEKLNDDTLEMPILEGPFIENPMSSLEPVEPAPPLVPPMSNLGFSQESLKDIQQAIGCTDEEMLILTLLGENTLEVENDILDLNTYKPIQSKSEKISIEKTERDSEKINGILKIDLKQRMTSALACLVNKAVFNLLRNYETMANSSVNPEALTLLGKLSSFSRRKNILQLNDLLQNQKVGEPSIDTVCSDLEKKAPALSYKYQCTICGNRFEKASTREFHISRTHKSKTKKFNEKTSITQSYADEDWNDSWNYDTNDESMGKINNSQFWCSDCGINFLSPQEVLQHQKLEHQAGIKESDRIIEAGPLQSSTIGSSDEIIEEKKPKRRTKLFSSEELDQQRILANNELRKLDRKFANKNKTNKIKWGMDALRFTVEKENKMIVRDEEEKEDDAEKSQNLDLIPKLNLSRTNNVPEFKVIQKNSLKNRFQKIIDNKLKRRSNQQLQGTETDEVETEVMLVPVVVKRKNKKFKRSKSKKDDGKKNVDIYDFNDSESENEPIVFSRVKKSSSSLSKLKLLKRTETPSKNKADSTTKDLVPDDYDSEDSLPLSVVKKFKPEYEVDEKEEKITENGVEKSDGILEQVEYLIEQLENETIPTEQKNEILPTAKEDNSKENKETCSINKKEIKEQSKNLCVTPNKGLRVSLTNKLLELQDLTLTHKDNKNEDLNLSLTKKASKMEAEKPAKSESNQSTFDEEDSIPLVHISKKFDERTSKDEENKNEENVTTGCTIENENNTLFSATDNKTTILSVHSPPDLEESLPVTFLSNENEIKNSNKSFETLNGNVIYCRNDSISDFESDLSQDKLIDSNLEKKELTELPEDFVEVTEKEDVVIVCSKGDDKKINSIKGNKKKVKSTYQKKNNLENFQKKKKRIPLLTATIEENSFRKSESPKLNKEVIVRKIWNRRKLLEEEADNDSIENIQNEESQTEVEKEFIMKKIWNRKKLDCELDSFEKAEEKLEDMKINQTEISDEVIIKCGPKTRISPKRRKSKSSTNECAKETIMRKIWSGKCTFQTKAALKTYDSDMIINSEENEMSEELPKPKKRGRPSGFSSTKKSKMENVEKDHDDDLDSLLEEIEREQLEKAIRSEFLQLRRSEKGNVEILKEGSNPTVGLFTETTINHKKNMSDRKRKKLKKNRKHPRQSLLARKRYLKKPIRRIFPAEEKLYSENSVRTASESFSEMRENFMEKNVEPFNLESKIKSRKHKKHRHKHHHHRHKHKKSKHHKCIFNKHKNKHKFSVDMDVVETTDSFTILEKICQDIPSQIENETHVKEKISKNKIGSETVAKIEDLVSPFSFEDSTKNCEADNIGSLISEKTNFQNGNQNICDFVDKISNF